MGKLVMEPIVYYDGGNPEKWVVDHTPFRLEGGFPIKFTFQFWRGFLYNNPRCLTPRHWQVVNLHPYELRIVRVSYAKEMCIAVPNTIAWVLLWYLFIQWMTRI